MTPDTAAKLGRHPLLDALDRARSGPPGEPFAPDERAELDRIAEELRAGGGVAHEDVPAWLEHHARELGELDE